MGHERRKHKRFSATAFLNLPVVLSPLPPYFDHAVKGKLIDLSAGGICLVMNELIPQGTFFNLNLKFPDHTILQTIVNAKHVMPRGKNFMHGFEFVTLSPLIAEKISNMSSDYIDCEARIQSEAKDPCRSNCAFFAMCTKPEKINLITEVDATLNLALKEIHSDVGPIIKVTNDTPLSL